MKLKLCPWRWLTPNISVLLILATIFVTTWGRQQKFSSLETIESLDKNRSSKLFPLFSIVRISNQPCTPDLTGVSGTCFTKSQCRNSGGVESGTCASGFGVCCVVSATCDSVITTNNTNFRNRDSPDSFSPSGLEVCNTRIQKPNANICQIRLDFLDFKIADADPVNGQCLTDHFSINGVSGTALPNLCGNLAGQHMYLDYGSSDRITLSLLTDGGALPTSRNWNIKVTYIECNSLTRAPDGCLQYFMTASGQVRMFGYPDSLPHLADLDYTVCVRSEDGSGSIVWSPCQGEDYSKSFFLTGITAAMSDGTGGATEGKCPKDYVLIMTDQSADPADPHDRYCGSVFFSPALLPPGTAATLPVPPFMLQSTGKPFIMRVKTDAAEDPADDLGNTGFCLAFRQQPPRPG